MKKIYLLLVLTLLGNISFAQTAATYSFSRTTGTYTSIVGGSGTTAITSGGVLCDDCIQTGIPIGFTFNFCGSSYTSCGVNSNGGISLSGTYMSTSASTSGLGAGSFFAFWNDAMGQAGTSSFYYQTSGTSPNMVFTAEWKDWGVCCFGAYYMNFQIKLYETSGKIQYVYGTHSSTPSMAIGIANGSSDFQMLATESATSTSTSWTGQSCQKPANGTILEWGPPCSGAPNAGTATASVTTGCGTYPTFLRGTGYTSLGGISTRWQSSVDSVIWTDVPGAVTDTFTAPVSNSAYYRHNVTCSLSSTSRTTTPIRIVNRMPAPIAGPSSLCQNASITLTSDTTGGIWSSSASAVASVNSTTGFIDGITGGTATISYTFSSCSRTKTVVVNALPTPYTIGGGSSYCAGGVGFEITLSGSETGFEYQLYKDGVAVGTPMAGTGAALNFGFKTAGGTYTAVGRNTASGCQRAMTGSTDIIVNPVPGPISGVTTVCVASTVTLSNSVSGGTWISSFDPVAPVDLSTGVVSGSNTGNVTITYTLPAGCYTTQTVNVLPPVDMITGLTNVCEGSNTLLSNTTFGGTWMSSNLSVATIGASSGLVRGIVAGNTDITYTISAGCRSVANVVVDAIPAAITGPSAVCVNSSVTLASATSGGTWSGSDGSIGGVDFSTGEVTGLSSGAITTTYTSVAGCITTRALVVNALPAVYNVTGGGSLCPGGAGVHIGTDFSNSGITYELYDAFGTTGRTVAGSSSSLDFGLVTVDGTYTVKGTNVLTGCVNDMTGSATVITNPLPVVYSLTGGGSYCAGGSGVVIDILSDFGVNYELYRGTTMVRSEPGNGGPISFTGVTAAGTYTAKGRDAITGCEINMLGSVNVSIDPLPIDHVITGGGAYCAGAAGSVIGLATSTSGIDYQLYDGTTLVGTAITGTGGAISFGSFTTSGTYYVYAYNPVTTCGRYLSGSVSVTINALPSVYNVTGGGAYCAGDGGLHIGVDFSSLGIDYQLFNGSTAVGMAVGGSSSSLDFGAIIPAGTYSVQATNAITGCQSNMAGTVNIIVNTVPSVFPVTGGGSYCLGGNGKVVGVGGSATGINYQLYLGTIPVGSTVSGTGGPLSFGLQTAAGVYSVVGADAATACPANMSGTTSISINPLPVRYNVTGGGTFCAGSTGVHVQLSGSNTGIQYQLYKGTLAVGSPRAGTGGMLDFGAYTATGTYTVMAMNPSTFCELVMLGSALIQENPLPNVYTVTGGGTYCTGGAGIHIGLSHSDFGIDYHVYRAGVATGTVVAGTGVALDLGMVTATGFYTVVAVDAATGCSTNMSGGTAVNVVPMPVAYTLTGGGTICEGAAGVPIRLSGSATGINYQLYNGTTAVGSSRAGTGALLDFGLRASAGTYKVIAVNGTSSCQRDMVGNPVIVVNPAPVAYAVTGGGSYCASAAGVRVGLVGSGVGNNYQLYNGSTAIGLPIGGTGNLLDFGLQRGSGTYRIVATSTSNGCSTDMVSAAIVTEIPSVVPTVTLSSGGDDTACIGQVTTFTASAASAGTSPVYAWSLNGTYVGGGSTYSLVANDGDIVSATVTSSATCAFPTTATASKTMNVVGYVMPTATIMATPGADVCTGTPVTYTSSTTYGGSAPAQTWFVNNVVVGTGASYSYTPTDRDILIMMLNSNYRCNAHDTIFSNNISMNVVNPLVPTMTINTFPGPIAVGQVDTLVAVITNGGSDPRFQWYIKGTPIPGAVNSMYVNNSFFNSDSITCVVTVSGPCGTATASKSVRVFLRNVGVANVGTVIGDVSIVPNPNKGTFSIKGMVASESVSIEVTNMMGQVVYRTQVVPQNGTIDSQVTLNSSVANGMYLVSLRSEGDSKVFHIVVEQ